MLAEWTGGLYTSTQHRVLHSTSGMRVSVPFFFDPNWDAVIWPVLPVSELHEQGEREGILYKNKFIEANEHCMVKL